MKKIASTLPNMLLSLTVICCVAAALLALVHQVTAPTIQEQTLATLQEGIRNVTPDFDNDPYAEQVTVSLEGDDFVIYPAKQNGALVGVAVESVSHNGFSGDVRVLVGMDMEGTIVNYTVLEQAETPGLGAKMDDFFRQEGIQSVCVIGRSLQTPLTVTKDGGDVDAITAATISSRAFLETLNKAFAAFSEALNNKSIE